LFSKFFDYISGTTSHSASELNKVEEEKLVPPLKDASVLCPQPPNHNSYSSKAKILHNSHRMSPKEESWFHLDPNSQNFYAPQNQFGLPPASKVPSPSYQHIYNINKGCYEPLPISVASGVQDTVLEEQQVEGVPGPYLSSQCQYQLVAGCGGVALYSLVEVMDLMEHSLVQSVCRRSEMEYNDQNRMAAEILAASTLNPNAAKEFTPKSSENEAETADEDSGGEFEHLDNLNVQDELSQSQKCHHDATPPLALGAGNSDEILHSGESLELSEEDVVDGDSITNNCDNNNLVIESDCEEAEDGEDDWDWDSDEERASVQCVDMAEFEDLFQVNLLVTNLVPCQPPASAPAPACPRLQEANRRYSALYPGGRSDKAAPCVVKFCDAPTIILEPDSLADDLHQARLSDFKQRQADRERMERLLAPVLTQTHRQNIYRKIYGEIL